MTHTEAVNPHLDIDGTGSFELARRTMQYMCDGHEASSEVVCTYTPTGQGKFTLPLKRMHYLFARFQQTQCDNRVMTERLNAKSFPEEVYVLAARCSKETTLQSAWSLPDNIRKIIHDNCCTTKERFSNPLNTFMHHQECWSTNKRDKLFGFKIDTLRNQWTGISLACPPSDNQQYVLKAVRHAIYSAQAADPSEAQLTIMFLPWQPKTHTS